jgi:glycosyltransferase involved in cell wall biosynthesis
MDAVPCEPAGCLASPQNWSSTLTIDAVYVSYWSLRDPLFQSQSLPVLSGLACRGWKTAAVTFEQDLWAVTAAERDALAVGLAKSGIVWHGLSYHRQPRLLATALDVAVGAIATAQIGRRHGARLYHGRGSVPGAMAWAAARLSGARFFYDADGPLSQEYVDAGIWRAGSLAQRLTAASEERCFRSADAVAVLTERRKHEVAALCRAEPVVLPCGVDWKAFRPQPEVRARMRRALGLQGRVLVYAGKAGGRYLTDPIFKFAAAFARLGSVTVLVVTTQDPAPFTAAATSHGVPCVVARAQPAEVPAYLSAADAGLLFLLSAPSHSACSPIKNGEYLACGLPVVTSAGIGDYSELIRSQRVGVVVDEPTATSMVGAAHELDALLQDPTLASRCRDVARRAVSLEDVVLPRYDALYKQLLGAPTAP